MMGHPDFDPEANRVKPEEVSEGLTDDELELCPHCGKKSVKAKMSGVECTTPGCGY